MTGPAIQALALDVSPPPPDQDGLTELSNATVLSVPVASTIGAVAFLR